MGAVDNDAATTGGVGTPMGKGRIASRCDAAYMADGRMQQIGVGRVLAYLRTLPIYITYRQ